MSQQTILVPNYKSLSAARGLSVLMMPSIHTVMLYSEPFIHQTGLGYFLRFFAECVSSHLYMFLMGLYLAIGKPKPAILLLQRSFLLFAAGYLLNVFRTYLPARLELLPPTFLMHYGATASHLWPLILTGDILQFAGIAYGVTGLVYKLQGAFWIAGFLVVFVAFLSPFCWGAQSVHPLLNHFLQLFTSKDTHAFFPVFPWICYPLVGLMVGRGLLSVPLIPVIKTALVLGLGLLLMGIIVCAVSPAGWEFDFYRSGPGGVLLHTGLVLLWLVFIRSLFQIRMLKHLIPLLVFCNKQITTIYIVHWIIVGWGMALAGYGTLSLYPTLFALCLVNALTAWLIWLMRGNKISFNRLVTN